MGGGGVRYDREMWWISAEECRVRRVREGENEGGVMSGRSGESNESPRTKREEFGLSRTRERREESDLNDFATLW